MDYDFFGFNVRAAWAEPLPPELEPKTPDCITFDDEATKWEASTCAPEDIFEEYEAGV